MPTSWRDASADRLTAPPEILRRWWTTFRDPVLDSLIERAVSGNLDLQIAEARIREARAARGIAAAGALPQVGASADYARTRRSESVPPFKGTRGPESPFGARDQNLFQAGFDASWEIDVFGGVRRDKEAALAQVQATEEAQRDVLVTLLADVARSYVELRSAQRRLTILDETLSSQRDTFGLVRARAQAGLATDLDVAQAEGLLAATTSQRPLLLRLAGEAVHRLGVLTGQGPDALTDELTATSAMPPVPLNIPATLPSELLSRRPDLRLAEREVAAATARVGVARADLFPRFAILGNFGRRSDEIGDFGSFGSQFWSVVPGVRWPILSGGRIRANIRVHDARLGQASQQYERAILTALQEVADALLSQARERDRQESLKAAANANRRALEVSLERYTGGVENFLAVLDAQRSVYAADEALVQNERDLAVSVIALYKSLGGGWSLESGS
jgi:NodT family efflux transporter outer membrane factor (OMF) lipoprotein